MWHVWMRERFSLYKYVQCTRYKVQVICTWICIHIFNHLKNYAKHFIFHVKKESIWMNFADRVVDTLSFIMPMTFAHGIRYRITPHFFTTPVCAVSHILQHFFDWFFFFFLKYISWWILYFVRRICVMYSFTLLSRF